MDYIKRYRNEKRQKTLKKVLSIVIYVLASVGACAVFYALLVLALLF
jgi:hypothetical protein